MGPLTERLRRARTAAVRAYRARLHPDVPDPAGMTSTASGETVDTSATGVNGFEVLAAVVDLPVSTWRYVWEADGVRHLGPMAQDWRASFGLGTDDRTICCTDANGVALVAIQALHRELSDLRKEVGELRTQAAESAVSVLRAADPAPTRTR
ncbi:tail fiber domain-containing protein [Streptomyces finlayi]|uniref:Tail fiber domain-containing protein n=1 Tax=Streptomyces finlayi TaxID=67296 RepID=A0A7G7BDB2_9ACTN|nr:tail fiber domain-containing protein [Streptomyces finlayi]QNE73327.1 tail fiber domain-containing protein [Streptomyces finlayi]